MNQIHFLSPIKGLLAVGFLFALLSCEKREVSDLGPASSNTNGAVFIDGFSPGLGYNAFENSFLTGFNVVDDVAYSGTSSMRFDVPNEGSPDGPYVGGIFVDTTGRDLSGYDAVTFWAKATIPGTINELGIGNDFGLNQYTVTLPNLQLSTYWKKYTIPLPDPSKLKKARGLFWYSEGPEDKKGYTFWIDEVKYEKLGNIRLMEASIFGGDSLVQTNFVGSKLKVFDMEVIANLGTGRNVTVNVAPSFFSFSSSNPEVAVVDEFGSITINTPGKTTITASLGGRLAEGSLTLNVDTGKYLNAPLPTKPQSDVISLFSNSYNNVNVDYFNGYWEPFQTTKSDFLDVNGDNVISYTNFNFVGVEFKNPTINASQMKFLHLDVYFNDPVVPETALYVDLLNQPNIRGKHKLGSGFLKSKQWNSCEIPITIISQKDKVFQIILDAPAGLIKSMYVDNIYFHK